jgi:glutamine amidotransferase
MIAIVDYNMGNLASVKNAFLKFGAKAQLVSDPQQLKNYDKVLLPGVGAFADAMAHLKSNAMDEAIIEYAKSGKYLLGICLGMQVLFEKGFEFGVTEGLGLIKGEVVAFDKSRFAAPLKVPHMGWNKVFTKNHPLFAGMDSSFYLYFVHSFHAKTQEKYTVATTHYGYDFVSGVANQNVLGLQPHPEKSHENGLKIIENFIHL